MTPALAGFLNEAQAAEKLNQYRVGKRPVTVTRIRYWKKTGQIPHVDHLGMTFYPETQLIDWIGSLPVVNPVRSPRDL